LPVREFEGLRGSASRKQKGRDMRRTAAQVASFLTGVLAFWLAHLLREAAAGVACGGAIQGSAVLRVCAFAAGLTVSSGLGAFLGLAAARGAAASVPAWLMAPAGVALGLLTEPAMDTLAAYGVSVRETFVGSLLAVTAVAAIFAWLGIQIVHSVRRRWPVIRGECRRIRSTGAERIALWLAVTPWILGLAQTFGVPGFG
jgi:hypothetical protein